MLQKKVMGARKGAMRELRKDTAAIAKERKRQAEASASERKAELRRNRAWLDEQQATFKQMAKVMPVKGGGSQLPPHLKAKRRRGVGGAWRAPDALWAAARRGAARSLDRRLTRCPPSLPFAGTAPGGGGK